MTTYLSQRDPRWANVKIGDTNLTIGRWGCTITSLCMLAEYFGEKVTPDKVARVPGLFNKDGKIIWANLNRIFKKFKFVERVYGRNDAKINNALAGKNTGCILEVDNNSHWVMPVRGTYVAKGYMAADPYTGKPCSVLEDYRNITGSAFFVRA